MGTSRHSGNGRARGVSGQLNYAPPPQKDPEPPHETNFYFLTPKGRRKYLTVAQNDPQFQYYFTERLGREVFEDNA